MEGNRRAGRPRIGKIDVKFLEFRSEMYEIRQVGEPVKVGVRTGPDSYSSDSPPAARGITETLGRHEKDDMYLSNK